MRTERNGVKYLLVTLGIIGITVAGSAQLGNSRVFSGGLPLEDLARALVSQYAKPVTVEGPLEMWRGEMKLFGMHRGTEVLSPRFYSLVLPADAGIFDAPSLNIDVIKKALGAYDEQNPGRSRYTVIESTAGLHIIPTHAHDAEGVVREVKSVLDTPVEILVGQRTASEHLRALLDNVSQLNGIPIRWISPSNFDGFYAANGNILPQQVMSDDRPHMLFQWGAHGMSARDALIDLLKNSATTMTWTLNCGPDFERGNQPICNFAPQPLIVAGRIVAWDRCTHCNRSPISGK